VTRVEEATEASAELVEAFARLPPQMTTSTPPPDAPALAQIIGSEAATVLIARNGAGEIVGTTTLVVFRIPAGVRAWIEDVIVDEAARGTGVVDALLDEAIGRARSAHARTVELTSNPTRIAGNKVYVRKGFQVRETNVYRYEL
jgi:ribosomal protein S18 acetylase RimI-like enzyme